VTDDSSSINTREPRDEVEGGRGDPEPAEARERWPEVRGSDDLLPGDEDLPVVARLMIEVRSDGRRTVARGAIEDVTSGKRTALVARGESPVRLAVDLTRAIMRLPGMAARGAVRGLLGRRGPSGRGS